MHTTIIFMIEAKNRKEAKEKVIYYYDFSGLFHDFAFTNFISWGTYKDISNPSVIRYNTTKGKYLLYKAMTNEECEIRDENFVELKEDEIETHFKNINDLWMTLIYCHL